MAPKLVPTGEVLEHPDFGFAEPNLGGPFGGFPSEHDPGEESPGDHGLDRDRPFDPVSVPMVEEFRLASAFQDPVPVLDPPAPAVPFPHPPRLLPGRYRQAGEQDPVPGLHTTAIPR